MRSRARKVQNATEGEIIEQVDKEDQSSDESSPDEEVREIQRMIKLKRNFLCKTLVEQARELCYSHSSIYKDFDSIFSKVIIRFQDWELYDDEEL